MLVEYMAGNEEPFTCGCDYWHDFLCIYFVLFPLVSRSTRNHINSMLSLEEVHDRNRGTAGSEWFKCFYFSGKTVMRRKTCVPCRALGVDDLVFFSPVADHDERRGLFDCMVLFFSSTSLLTSRLSFFLCGVFYVCTFVGLCGCP